MHKNDGLIAYQKVSCHPFLESLQGPCLIQASHWKLPPPAAAVPLGPDSSLQQSLRWGLEGKGPVRSRGEAAQGLPDLKILGCSLDLKDLDL